MRRAEIPAISSTAARNAASLALDGLLKPLIFLTNWSDAARISSAVTGGSKLKSVLIFLHIPLTSTRLGFLCRSLQLKSGLMLRRPSLPPWKKCSAGAHNSPRDPLGPISHRPASAASLRHRPSVFRRRTPGCNARPDRWDSAGPPAAGAGAPHPYTRFHPARCPD